MQYTQIHKGVFLSRPNRFIAHVEIDGQTEIAHVMNTGRCRELLVPGAAVYLRRAESSSRKTKWDLIAVEKMRSGDACLINMDSSAPNEAAARWLPVSGIFSPDAVIRREVRRGKSRFDFMLEDGGVRTWLEVKGVTLEENGVARFPDAPTERGARHLRELMEIARSGEGAAVLFVLQMEKMRLFRPNEETDPAFAQALRQAEAAGVRILVRQCAVTPHSMRITDSVPYLL